MPRLAGRLAVHLPDERGIGPEGRPKELAKRSLSLSDRP